MTGLEELYAERSQQTDCTACGETDGLAFDRVHGTFDENEVQWALDARECEECGYTDVVARNTQYSSDETAVLLFLASPSDQCFNCDGHAAATVVEKSNGETASAHFCHDHATEQIRALHHRIKRLTMEL